MKYLLAILVGLIPFCFAAADEPKPPPDDALVRGRQAYHFYTAAVSNEEAAVRLSYLSRAIELDPKFYRAYYNRGVLYARDKALDKAEADFVKTTELYPDYLNAHYNLACVQVMAGREEEALASVERALQKGYRRFDKLRQDEDLAPIAKSESFVRMVAKYEAAADPTLETTSQKMQIETGDERTRILLAEIEEPSDAAADVAEWGMLEAGDRNRTLAMLLWRRIDNQESRQRLVMGLYDVNGYVCKAAGNSLVTYGKEIAEIVSPILNDKEYGAPFFAMQILARVDARECVPQIVPYLKHDAPNTRTMAAHCLAEVQAQDALPEIKAALENAPVDGKAREAYRAKMLGAIEALEGGK